MALKKKGVLFTLGWPDKPTSTSTATRTTQNIPFATCLKSTKMTKRTSWTSKKGCWLINMPPLVSWSPPFIFRIFFWHRRTLSLEAKVFSFCANKVHWNFCYIFDCAGKIKQKSAKSFIFFGLDFCERQTGKKKNEKRFKLTIIKGPLWVACSFRWFPSASAAYVFRLL